MSLAAILAECARLAAGGGAGALASVAKRHGSLPMSATAKLLAKIPGAQVVDLDAGCCGMAGSFGFKPEHYELSIAAGEKGGLLPAVRAADTDTLIISNGYSCREQIAQSGKRRALHIAEVARMALDIKV